MRRPERCPDSADFRHRRRPSFIFRSSSNAWRSAFSNYSAYSRLAGAFRSSRTFDSLPDISERRIHGVRFAIRGKMSRRPSNRREAMSLGAFGASSFVIRDRPSIERKPAPRSPLLDGRLPFGRLSGERDKPFRSVGLRRRARRCPVLAARFLALREFGGPDVLRRAVRASRPIRRDGPDDGLDQFSQRFLRR